MMQNVQKTFFILFELLFLFGNFYVLRFVMKKTFSDCGKGFEEQTGCPSGVYGLTFLFIYYYIGGVSRNCLTLLPQLFSQIESGTDPNVELVSVRRTPHLLKEQ